MAKVRVVLTQPVEKLGEAGDVTMVAGGYARNYLIPRGLAVPGTKGNVKQADTWRTSRENRMAREQAAAEDIRQRLESAPLKVTGKAGPDGRLFGSITTTQIARTIRSQLGIAVDRHDVHLADPIRHLGIHEARVRLHAEVTATLSIEAVAQT